jgi:hypothetical protein
MQSSAMMQSISLNDATILSGDQMPASVKRRFTESYQHSLKDQKMEGCVDFDEVLLELVGSVVNAKLTSLHAVSLLMSIEFSNSNQVMAALTDSLWFWGTQVLIDLIS